MKAFNMGIMPAEQRRRRALGKGLSEISPREGSRIAKLFSRLTGKHAFPNERHVAMMQELWDAHRADGAAEISMEPREQALAEQLRIKLFDQKKPLSVEEEKSLVGLYEHYIEGKR